MPTEELFGAYNFLLEISGVTPDSKTIIGGFKSVSGMDSETEVIEFKQGNDHVIRKKPGRTEYQRGIVRRAADGGLEVRTTGNQGSGVLSSMVQANGLIVLHHDQGHVAVGDEVDVMMFEGPL